MCSATGNLERAKALKNADLRKVRKEILTGKWHYAQGAIELAIARIACGSSEDCEDACHIWATLNKVEQNSPDYEEFKIAVMSCMSGISSKYKKIALLCTFINET